MGPAPLEDLIDAFGRLPGIGRKTAQRLAFYVIKQPPEVAGALAKSITEAREGIEYCRDCFNFTERGVGLCKVCNDPQRDRGTICVVEEASDVLVLEFNKLIRGLYHVLGGTLSPLNGVRPDDLRISELVDRVNREGVTEVILALNSSVEGDATAEYLRARLAPTTKVTRPARGLPVGADLDLADRVTLAHALEGRHTV
jgi:recombination protein RecR